MLMKAVNSQSLSSHYYFYVCEKFINLLMRDGKKIQATKLYLETLVIFKSRIDETFGKTVHQVGVSSLVHQAIHHILPSVQVRKVRIAGTPYLVPSVVEPHKQLSLALRWILEGARKKKTTTHLSFAWCLADELFDCYCHQGYAQSQRNQLHSLAEANRAYVRYRWW